MFSFIIILTIAENVHLIETASSSNNTTLKCAEEQEDMEAFAFWMGGVLEIIIAIVGLVANSVAVPLLTRFIQRPSDMTSNLPLNINFT